VVYPLSRSWSWMVTSLPPIRAVIVLRSIMVYYHVSHLCNTSINKLSYIGMQ
jgi:hypothetical protein